MNYSLKPLKESTSMLRLLKFLFFFVAFAEGGLYFWDSFGPEMMFTDTWSIQEVRLVIVVLASIAFVSSFFFNEKEA
jgi:uncharacterized membrane protein